jgi:hypothetical protein
MNKQILIYIFIAALFSGPTKLKAQWLADTLAYSDHYIYGFSQNTFFTDNQNTHHLIFGRDVFKFGPPNFKLFYSKKRQGENWISPQSINLPALIGEYWPNYYSLSADMEDHLYMLVARNQKLFLGVHENAGWDFNEVLNLNNDILVEPHLIIDKSGNFHIGLSYFEKFLYLTNICDGWAIQELPINFHLATELQPFMEISPQGIVHLFHTPEIGKLVHQTNNIYGGTQWQSDTLTAPYGKIISAKSSSNQEQFHLAIQNQQIGQYGIKTNWIFHYQLEEGLWSGPTLVNHAANSAGLHSMAVNNSDELVITYGHDSTNGLYLSRLANGVFEDEAVAEWLWQAGISQSQARFDKENNLMLLINARRNNNSGETTDLFLIREIKGNFNVSFEITNQTGHPVTDAIVTFDDHTANPGQYLFEGIQAGYYQYTIARDGYHPVSGYLTVEDDLTISVSMVSDETMVGLPSGSEIISIYPNPASNFLYANIKGSFNSINLFDISGRLIKQLETDTQKIKLDIRGLQPGLYILNATDGKTMVNYKVIIDNSFSTK